MTNVRGPREPGRGWSLLALGVCGLLLLGPLSGIPAWIMGRNDLKKIAAGVIPVTQKTVTRVGMIFGIIGTFISPFTVLAIIVVMFFNTYDSDFYISRERDAFINDLEIIAKAAFEYRTKPTIEAGGGGSYGGFSVPKGLPLLTTQPEKGVRLDEHLTARFDIEVISSNLLKLRATSAKETANSVIVFVDEKGKLKDWRYEGDFVVDR